MSSYEPRPREQNHTLGEAIVRGDRSPELLEAVLRTTLAASGAEETLDPQTREAIAAVAARHSGKAVRDAPVAQELVAAVLRGQFGAMVSAPAAWEDLTSLVAQTLLEDPAASRRLESLWLRLCGSAK